MSQLRAGLIQFAVGGVLYDARGAFTYNLGAPKRTALVGSDGVHGYSEAPQVAYIEGEVTDRGNLDLATLVSAKDVTVTLALANGKVISLRDAWFAADGQVSTEAANIQVRFEGPAAEEIA